MIWLIAYTAAIHVAGGICAYGSAKETPPESELNAIELAAFLAVWPVFFLYGFALGIHKGVRSVLCRPPEPPSPPLTPQHGE